MTKEYQITAHLSLAGIKGVVVKAKNKKSITKKMVMEAIGDRLTENDVYMDSHCIEDFYFD